MKKKVFYLMSVAVIGIAAWNVSKSNNEVSLSDVALQNIEALASGEYTVVGCCQGSGLCIHGDFSSTKHYPCAY